MKLPRTLRARRARREWIAAIGASVALFAVGVPAALAFGFVLSVVR